MSDHPPLSRRRAAAAVAGLPLAFAAAPAAHASGPRPSPPRTIHIAGDSTAATKLAGKAPETGWGQVLPLFLRDHLRVSNHAVNGASSRSFIEQLDALDPILDALRPGDWLFTQFGHNDQKTDERGTDPYTTYQDHLTRYVTGARARRARPVLLTSVERRRFDAEGRAAPSLGEYPRAMRELAAELRVPLVDVHAASLARWDELGPDGTRELFLHLAPGEHPNHPSGVQDNTHFNARGAIEVARMAVRGLLAARVLHPGDARRVDAEIPESAVTWPES
ncbi:rhamnogalacturonan acetylesterase [Streptomyces capparidis]